MVSQAKGSPELLKFLEDYLGKQLHKTLFVNDLSQRPIFDGQAMAYSNILDIIRSLSDD